jgi:ElaB/YqjD/DUF883 family membrane-anchored ribosome-binding protein
MADQPEVIQHELEQTRHSLAEKLEQIGEKISGTVETVTETVSNVTETVSNVTEAVEGTVQKMGDAVSGTVESVKETVENVGEKAAETVESVRHAFNLSEQVQNHPWACFGGSVLLGFIGGKLAGGLFSSRTHEAESFVSGQGYYDRAAAPEQGSYMPTGDGWSRDHGTSPQAADTSSSSSSTGLTGSWLSGLMQQFGPEIDKLKGLALGTLFGVARDMVSQSLPETLKDQVTHLFNDFTEKAGGNPIEGSVLGESSQGDAGGSQGAEHAQSSSTGMDRPMGAPERKSKAGVGRSDRR